MVASVPSTDPLYAHPLTAITGDMGRVTCHQTGRTSQCSHSGLSDIWTCQGFSGTLPHPQPLGLGVGAGIGPGSGTACDMDLANHPSPFQPQIGL